MLVLALCGLGLYEIQAGVGGSGTVSDGWSVEGDGGEGDVLMADKRDPFGVPGTTLTGVALLASLDEEVKQSRLVYAAVSQSA